MRINNYLDYTRNCEEEMSKTFSTIAKNHISVPDVHSMCKLFSIWCDEHVKELEKQIERFGEKEEKEFARMEYSVLKKRKGSLGLLRDLHDIYLMTTEIKMSWVILLQSAKALRDSELELSCMKCGNQVKQQTEWTLSKIKLSASQVLTVPV